MEEEKESFGHWLGQVLLMLIAFPIFGLVLGTVFWCVGSAIDTTTEFVERKVEVVKDNCLTSIAIAIEEHKASKGELK